MLLVAAAAGAQEKKSAAAVDKARAALDASDKAFNDHDLAAFLALLDKSYFAAGPTIGSRHEDLAAAKTDFEKEFARGGRITRDAITLRSDDDGDVVWFIADYTYVPKVGPGVLPVHRKVRESGVLIKRGKDWKIAMWHTAFPAPDMPPTPPAAGATPPPAAAPVKK
jgi:hypothetical protein